MKRMFIFFAVVLFATVNVLAQEVHGVESKMVCTHNCNPNGSWDNWGKYESGIGYQYQPWFSFEFTNMNSIPVSVEVELYHYECVKGFGTCDEYDYVLRGTKSLVLNSKESYVWKNGKENGIDKYNREIYERNPRPGHKGYYVIYKAYKLL